MTDDEIFSLATSALQQLRGRADASYLLYCSEQQRAWVAAARPRVWLTPGATHQQFLDSLRSGGTAFFLASPTFTAEASAWPVAVVLEPVVELQIDRQGVRVTVGDDDASLRSSLARPAAKPSTGRGLVRWDAWQGEDDREFSLRLERAIAATRGRSGKVIVSRRYQRDTHGADPLQLLNAFGAAEPNAAAIHFVELSAGLISMGTSPENIVELQQGQLSIDAVAGTRPRTGDDATDAVLRDELLHSAKERHEHGLAVERARAFAQSVCRQGAAGLLFTRRVRALRAVQHLHSRAGGALLQDLDFAALVGRCHPPLMSYPTELAAQFPPPWPGHFYGGMVGRVSGADGSAFLNLRCLEIEAQRINAYAGVGIVDGSSLESELAEVRNKLGTATDAVEQWLSPGD
jgi:isochorismate synthase EntC